MSQYEILQVALGFILELISVRAACEVLEMRSNLAYVLLHIGSFIVSYSLRALGAHTNLTVVAIAVFTYIVLPVAMSRGSLRGRILRMSLINSGVIITEALGALFYSFISGDIAYGPAAFSDESVIPVIIVYCMLIPASAIVTELIITFCKSFDHQYDVSVELPIILLMTIPFCLYPLLMLRILSAGREHGIIPFIYAIDMLASLAIALVMLIVARRDAEAQRRIADRAAISRQDRHVRSQVEASVHRAMEMSRLRHDLSNQVEVVELLTAQGNYADADHYLALLQEQAHELGGAA